MQAKITVFMRLLVGSRPIHDTIGDFGAPGRASGTAVARFGAGELGADEPGASAGRIPANVSLAARASVTAGLANDVDDVNQ